MWAGPESGDSSTVLRDKQCQQLRQRVLADLIDERGRAAAALIAAPMALSMALRPPPARPACRGGRGVIRHRRVPVGRPVAAGWLEQGLISSVGRSSVTMPRAYSSVNRRRTRSQMRRLGLDAAGAHEAHERIQHVFRGRRRDARVGEPPLQFARPRAVEAELDGSPDQAATRLARNDSCMSSSRSKRRPRRAVRSRTSSRALRPYRR